MDIHLTGRRRSRVAVVGLLASLAIGGTAAAFQALPPAGQVNDDSGAGIDKTRSVSGEDPANADVTGGALTAGKPAVPWAIFRQTTAGHDQVFSRSFANGAWTTRGNGTAGGRSSASPTFPGSLNFDQTQDGEAPAIDFAGAGRTVPWATWYENTTGAGFANNNVFASRFDNTGDANQGKWIFAGQGRGNGGSGPVVPSLNIRTGQSAENPAVAGGSAVDPTKPGPWVAWQETTTSPVNGKDQIFVTRPLGPGQANCDGVKPAGIDDGTGHVPAVGGFCWQQVGVPRVGPGAADPSLNVDPTRDGVEPDIAFTGANDAVPWVVWYETGSTTLSGPLHGNDIVFAAKGVSDGVSADGGFHWVAVGSQLSATLDTTGATNHFGTCAESATNEEHCSLNKNTGNAAEDPRVAAGTMNPANPTVPWVAWAETLNGVKQIFVSRLVGGTHFELANGGAPLSVGANDSTRPDITFSGNTPYVSWQEDTGGGIEKAFAGHFVNPANPTFVLDESDVSLTPSAQASVREPISSACTANPFNVDGSACQGGAVGTPFFLFTNGTTPRGLFADAYQPDAPVPEPATGVTTSSATLNGAVVPHGAAVNAFFQFGPTPAYGQSTSAQKTAPDGAPATFSASLSGLPPGTPIHFRAVVATDFGTFFGQDATLVTATSSPSTSPPPSSGGSPGPRTTALGRPTLGRLKIAGTVASQRATCAGASGATCRLSFRLAVFETFLGRRLLSVAPTKRPRRVRRLVVLGTVNVTLAAGRSRLVRISLNRTGRRLLSSHRTLRVRLRVLQSLGGKRTRTLEARTITFHRPRRR